MTWKELCTLSPGDILAWADDQPWFRAMAECKQDEGWHSEGDVWTHSTTFEVNSTLRRPRTKGR